VTVALLVVGSFVTMEAVSYASHRWLMHGPGMVWHRSHHRPPEGRFERNDLFPLCFSVLGVAAFAAAALVPSLWPLRWIGVGTTLYGMCYLVVHEVVIHRRVGVDLPRWSYLEWLRDSHRIHHLFGGEPFGMLAPFVPRSLRVRAEAVPRDPLERSILVTRRRL
jgi:beta-carotene 3-hydroxylase